MKYVQITDWEESYVDEWHRLKKEIDESSRVDSTCATQGSPAHTVGHSRKKGNEIIVDYHDPSGSATLGQITLNSCCTVDLNFKT